MSIDFRGDHVVVIGADDVVGGLDAMNDRLGDMRPIMEGALRDVMIRSAQLTFEAQGARSGGWPELKEATLAKKRGTDLMLEDTLQLVRSLSPDGNEWSINVADEHSTYIGTSRPGAFFNQEGTSTLPQRRFLLSQPEDVDDEKQIVADFVVRGFTGGQA